MENDLEMKNIDIKAIIEAKGLNITEVAQQLFPTNQYARLAINRVIAGKAVLDATQISKLALFANMSMDELYENGAWKADSKDGLHHFTNGDFIAKLDTNTWITKIFHKKSMIHESIIHSKNTPLSQYLEALNNVITNIK